MITPSFSPTATERVLPKLALDFTTASLDPRVTFTRTTGASNPATYVNSNGYVTAATDNQPRFDYSPTTLSCKGLLIEESRINKCLYSEDFTNSFWTLATGTRSANTTVSPSGLQDADSIYNGYVQSTGSIFATSTTQTISCYFKSGNTPFVAIRYTAITGSPWSYYDLNNGVVGTAGSGVTISIQNAGNGWYRCIATATTGASITTNRFDIAPASSDGVVSTTGTTLTVWGAQVEAGAFATSYIPTTTTALTRNADVATMTGTNFSSWFNASQGAWKITFDSVIPSSNDSATVCAFYFDANYRILNYLASTNSFALRCQNSGSVTAIATSGGYSPNTTLKLSSAYKVNSFAIATNGATPVLATSGTLPSTTPTTLSLGSSYGTAGFLNGHVQKFYYYNQRIINAEVQAFSKG